MTTQDGLPARERLRALVVIILGIAMSVLDGTIVNLALPDITRALNASAAQSIWVINAYQIATLALLIPLATLGDVVGYRRVYLVGMGVFAIASVAWPHRLTVQPCQSRRGAVFAAGRCPERPDVRAGFFRHRRIGRAQ